MKRRKTVIAGDVTYAVITPMANPRDDEAKRKKINQISAAARARMNCNAACRKLEFLIASNYAMHDLVFSLTYRDDNLPSNYKEAQKLLGKFLRWLRDYRKARGQELRYIYVTEGMHGDHRLHHHLIINATGDDLEVVRSLWHWGDEVQMSYIREKGYEGWARYLSKERREGSLNGKLMYIPSRNLKKPIVKIELVGDDVSIEAPPGAVDVVESGDRNEYASYKYVKYRMPRHNLKSSDSFFSDLKHTLTDGNEGRKRIRHMDKSQRKPYNKDKEKAV